MILSIQRLGLKDLSFHLLRLRLATLEGLYLHQRLPPEAAVKIMSRLDG
jgi:hypothetical protein